MSTPEARLSAAERAALADLESAAAAADPHLAARLRGRAPSRALPALVTVITRIQGAWAWVLRWNWWGIPPVVIGLFLVVLGLAYGLVLSVLGLVVAAVGLRVLAEMVERRWLAGDRPSRRLTPDR